ncbi:MAG: hypothetical protein KC503_15140 [Myxococcales bacterium]|nr:hypothetical protein [Myxococcales bacterium]
MLAGRVRLKTFVMVAIPLLAGAGFALYYFVLRPAGDTSPPDTRGSASAAANTQTAQKAPQKTTHETTPSRQPGMPPAGDNSNLIARAVDLSIMRYVGKDLGAKKIKDALKGMPYKVNLYQDKDATTLSRVKIDLDRDGTWDEVWKVEGSKVKRKASPADDGNYTDKYRWTGNGWRRKR